MMTVGDLIELLETFPPDAKVFAGDINTLDFMTVDDDNFQHVRSFEDDGFPAGVYILTNTSDEIEAGLEDMGALR